ncbi:O-antigen ligase family protein [Pseudomonas luteola]|uniref:O-antigen ligase family protein n=1 Tax=Pseudomonas luteola TaxID=47886 RepID=UPI003DA024B4
MKKFICAAPVLVLFLLVLVFPFLIFVHLFPLGNFLESFLSSVVVTAAFGCFAVCLIRRSGLILSNLSCLIFFLGMVWCFESLINGVDWADLIQIGIYFTILMMAAQVALWLNNDRHYYGLVAGLVAVGGLLEGLIAITFHYGLDGGWLSIWMGHAQDRMTGTIGQANLLAIYIYIAFLSTVYLFLKRHISFGFSILAALFFGYVIAGSGSRAALGYLVVTLSLLFFFCFKTKEYRLSIRFFCIVLALLLALPLYSYVDSVLQPALYDMGYIQRKGLGDMQRDYAALGFRPSEMHKAFLMFLDNPILGVGYGRYAVNSFWMGVKYPWAVTEETLATHSHNIFGQVLAEFGAVGFLAFFVFVVVLSLKLLKIEKSKEWWLGLSVAAVFSVNALLEYALWYIHFAVLLVFFVSPLVGGRCVKKPSGVSILAVIVALCLTCICLIASSLDIYKKIMRYGSGVNDSLQAYDLRIATSDPLWGRDMQILELSVSTGLANDSDYYEKVTSSLMGWKPFDLVLIKRLQVLGVEQKESELKRIAEALVRMYPSRVNLAREYLTKISGIKDTRAEKILNEILVPI